MYLFMYIDIYGPRLFLGPADARSRRRAYK